MFQELFTEIVQPERYCGRHVTHMNSPPTTACYGGLMTMSFSHEADVARLNNSGHTEIRLQPRTEIQAVCSNTMLAHVYHGHLITDTPATLVLRNRSETSILLPQLPNAILQEWSISPAFSPISLYTCTLGSIAFQSHQSVSHICKKGTPGVLILLFGIATMPFNYFFKLWVLGQTQKKNNRKLQN